MQKKLQCSIKILVGISFCRDAIEIFKFLIFVRISHCTGVKENLLWFNLTFYHNNTWMIFVCIYCI